MSKKLTLFSKEYIEFNGIKTRDVTLDFNTNVSIVDDQYSLDQLHLERSIFLVQYIKAYLKVLELKPIPIDAPKYDLYFWKSHNDAKNNPLSNERFRLGIKITIKKNNNSKHERFIAFELPYKTDDFHFWDECSFAHELSSSLQSFTSESIATNYSYAHSYARSFEDINTSASNFNDFLLEIMGYMNLY